MSLGLTDFPLRGGWQRAVIYDPATAGALADVRLGDVARADPEPERLTLNDGTEDEIPTGRALAVQAWGEAEADQLDAWAAAGTAVRAVALALGRGEHRVWRESVPCLVSPRTGPSGATGGRDVLLASSLPSPAVYDSTDLLADLAFGAGGDWTATAATWGTDADGYADADLASAGSVSVETVLPAAGLAVEFGVDVTALSDTLTLSVDARDSAGSSLGAVSDLVYSSGVRTVSAVLPAGTWSVVVTAATASGDTATVRTPALLTRAPYGGPAGSPTPGGGALGASEFRLTGDLSDPRRSAFYD